MAASTVLVDSTVPVDHVARDSVRGCGAGGVRVPVQPRGGDGRAPGGFTIGVYLLFSGAFGIVVAAMGGFV